MFPKQYLWVFLEFISLPAKVRLRAFGLLRPTKMGPMLFGVSFVVLLLLFYAKTTNFP